jgi:thiamine pyrophosphokinase
VHIALVLNGLTPNADQDQFDFVICADGGARHVLEPNLVVGDGDSYDGPVHLRSDPAKDETDGELALEQALARSPTKITILGGHGGRTAMFLANLKLLRRAHDVCEASMVHGNETIRYGLAGQTVNVGAGTLNLLAVSADARVTVTGAAWSGQFKLPQTTARGVSNPVPKAATVRIESGCVMVIHESAATKLPE